MPLINVKLIEDVFTPDQKREIVERLTSASLDRGREHAPGHLGRRRGGRKRRLGIGGKPLSTDDVKALAAGAPA